MPTTVTPTGNGAVSTFINTLIPFQTATVYGAQTDTSFGFQTSSVAWVFNGTGFGGYSGLYPNTGVINTLTRHSKAGGLAEVDTWDRDAATLTPSDLKQWIAANNVTAFINYFFSGADTITGSAYADTLYGYDGSDVFNPVLGAGGDRVEGEGGNDRIRASGMAAGDFFSGGSGTDTLAVIAGSTLFDDPSGRFDGYYYSDFSAGSFGGIERLTFEGATEGHLARFTAAQLNQLGLRLNGSTGEFRDAIEVHTSGGTVDFNNLLFFGWDDSLWAVQDIFRIVGSGVADDITGTTRSDYILGNGGDDILNGDYGHDTLIGGAGLDLYNGGEGGDTLIVHLSGMVVGEVYDGGDYLVDEMVLVFDSATSVDLRPFDVSGLEYIKFDTHGASPATLEIRISADQFPQNMHLFGSGAATADTLIIDLQTGDFPYFYNMELVNWDSADRVMINGSATDEDIYGTFGNDTIDGGGGQDLLAGEDGDDTFYVDSADDVVLEQQNEGVDTIYSSVSRVLDAGVEKLILTGGGNLDATGNDLSNVIVGTGGDNAIDGGSGADTIDGQGGDDTITGGGGSDTISGGDGNDVLYGHSSGASGAITSEAFATGMNLPVAGAIAPGDPGFIYVLEKDTGIVWRTDVETGARTQFLDIPQEDFSRDGEGGALGIAFHPNYDSNGRFFVFMTDPEGDLQVREFDRVPDSVPPTAGLTSTPIIEIGHPTYNNHNGGWIAFSPTDGYLYIATGDGGGGGDPNNNAQNIESLLGKILRININADAYTSDPNRNYDVPDNPFVKAGDDPPGREEIWHYGLRNPFRSAFDPRNGDLYIGDVGQSAREEVDYAANGVGGINFGWRIMEGTQPYPPGSPDPNNPSLIDPIYEYGRTIGTTITGGEIYVGANTGFVGQYVFADYGSDRLFTLRVENGVAYDALDRTGQISGPAPTDVVDFVSDSEGNLYAIGLGGTIWRLTPAVGAEDVGDILNGGAGNDTLDGNFGADQMYGGDGNDTYYVDNAGDVIWEALNAGTDTVVTSIHNYTLRNNFENLVLGGSIANGGGNSLNNTITGNAAANLLWGGAGNDTLDGGAGIDTLTGEAGDDTYYYEAGDVIWEGVGAGTDTVITSVNNYTLRNNFENLTLGASILNGGGNALNNTITGNALNNLLWGGAGDDTLDGAGGTDTFDAGAGDDTYIIDTTTDVVWEAVGAGTDTVIVSFNNYTLRNNFENLVLAGSTANGGGNALHNVVTGNASNNLLWGGAGNDTLDGAGGADTFDGGAGDDTYIIDSASDVVWEGVGAGTDTVVVSFNNYSLRSNFENLVLADSIANGGGNALNNTITGNALNNLLWGGAGNDVLDGLAGADTFNGEAGDDTYVIDNAGDVVWEGAGAGTDTVIASISYTLRNNFENLTLAQSAGAINGIGNGLANQIRGNSANNVLTGNAGDDAFVFLVGSGDDTVSDFVAGGADDYLDLSAYDSSGVTWNISQAGADTVFDFSNGDSITLLNVNMNDLVHTSTFIYD